MKKETVETENPQFEQFERSYIKTSDCAAGQEAIKRRGEAYLPKLPGQKSDAKNGDVLYNLYRDYASFFGGVGRTVDGYLGLAFRKNPVFVGDLNGFETDVTLDGEPLDTFSKKLMRDMIIKYRPGILVDLPQIDTSVTMTVAQMADVARPYFTLYTTDSILDWREERINGRKITSFVKLQETEYRAKSDNDSDIDFKYEKIYRIRVLSITPEGFYSQTVLERSEDDDEYTEILTVEPIVNGKKLDYIPFIPCNPSGVEWELDYSVINDLCDVVISHYRNSASYQNGLLISGCPTLCVAGLLENESANERGEIVLGASSALKFDTGGQWGFLQIGTDGLSEIRTSMDRFEKQMAILGSRILQADRASVESAQAASIHRSGENGVLGNICNSVSLAITEALKIVADWLRLPVDNIEYSINTDFEDSKLTAQDLATLMQALQAGVISRETFYYNLSKGEIYKSGWTAEDENEAINADMTESFGVSDERYAELTAKIESLTAQLNNRNLSSDSTNNVEPTGDNQAIQQKTGAAPN